MGFLSKLFGGLSSEHAWRRTLSTEEQEEITEMTRTPAKEGKLGDEEMDDLMDALKSLKKLEKIYSKRYMRAVLSMDEAQALKVKIIDPIRREILAAEISMARVSGMLRDSIVYMNTQVMMNLNHMPMDKAQKIARDDAMRQIADDAKKLDLVKRRAFERKAA